MGKNFTQSIAGERKNPVLCPVLLNKNTMKTHRFLGKRAATANEKEEGIDFILFAENILSGEVHAVKMCCNPAGEWQQWGETTPAMYATAAAAARIAEQYAASYRD